MEIGAHAFYKQEFTSVKIAVIQNAVGKITVSELHVNKACLFKITMKKGTVFKNHALQVKLIKSSFSAISPLMRHCSTSMSSRRASCRYARPSSISRSEADNTGGAVFKLFFPYLIPRMFLLFRLCISNC